MPGNAASIIALIGPLVGLVIAVVFTAFALRGRRVATAPRCRRCGYDVSQRPRGVERCSECGADLTARHAIATASHRPRWTLAACGVLVCVLAIAFGVNAERRVDWHAQYLRRAPLAWLIADATHDHSTTGDDYRVAWRDRGGRRGEYLDHLLDLQRDVAGRPNLRPMFDGMEAAFLDGTLTPAQQKRYVEGLMQGVDLRASTRARVGGMICWTTGELDRVGVNSASRLRFQTDAELAIDADAICKYENGFADVSLGSSLRGWNPALLSNNARPIAPGPHRLTLRIGYRLFRDESGSRSFTVPPDAKPIWPAVEVAKTFDLDVVPRNGSLGRAIVDPARADVVARAVDLNVFDPSWKPGTDIRVSLGPAPVDRAFVVSVIVKGGPRRIGIVAARANEGGEMYAGRDVADVLEKAAGPFTIVLDGSDDALETATGQDDYWAGRIVYSNVASEGPKGQRYGRFRPTTAPCAVTPVTTTPTTSP